MVTYSLLSRNEINNQPTSTSKVRPIVWIPVITVLLCSAAYVFHTNPRPKIIYQDYPHSVPPSGSALMGLDEFTSCNPFSSLGRLLVDIENPTKIVWKPYDSDCNPSSYLKALYRAPGDTSPLIAASDIASSSAEANAFRDSETSFSPTREYLPWLMNKTLLIHGDSIDRFHLKDFCDLVGGNLFNVGTNHPANPIAYTAPHIVEMGSSGEESEVSKERWRIRQEKEYFWNSRGIEGQTLTNPWVCDVEEYGFTMINVFNFGLEGAENFFGTERWYHGPATYMERLDAITIPLLENLATFLNRPQIMTPDLIEINSGLWDLRRFTEEDFTAKGFSRPYPEDNAIPYTMMGLAREVTWEKEARKAIKLVARRFKGKDGRIRSGPTIIWRTLHHPPRHNYAPYNRVFALDSLARKVLADLSNESSSSYRKNVPVSHRIMLEQAVEGEDLGLDERLRVDEWGTLMLGQEHLFRDLLHPASLPGSYIWGDIILYELKRAIKRVGRS